MPNISTENINTLAQAVASIGDGDYIYILKSGASSFARIELNLFIQALGEISGSGSGSIDADTYAVIQGNVNTVAAKVDELLGKLANLSFDEDKPAVIGDLSWDSGGGDEPSVRPVLTSPAINSTVNIGQIASDGTNVSKAITVKGSGLTKDLTILARGTGFSVSPSVLSYADVNNGTSVTVTYTNTGTGDGTTKSGSLSISSDEVSRSISLNASKAAEEGGDEPPIVDEDYISNGLVLNLDGTDRGGTSGHWIDKVAGYDFELVGNPTEQNNGVEFNDGTKYGSCTNANLLGAIPEYSVGTIEICFTTLSGFNAANTVRTLVKPSETGQMGAVVASSGTKFCYGADESSAVLARNLISTVSDESLQTVSASAAQLMQNGVLSTASAVSANIKNNRMSAFMIGCGIVGGSSTTWAMAVIHSVRIYSRQLSESEMSHNQAIDLAKYGN